MQGQSMSETSLKGKESYPMIDSAEAAAPGRAVDDAYVYQCLYIVNLLLLYTTKYK